MQEASLGAAGGSGLSARSRPFGEAAFHPAFTGESGKPHAMNSPVARFSRLFMLALMLVTAGLQPSAAQDDSGPSILRDSETELLFKDVAAPLIRGAGLDPNSVQVVLLNDSEINAFVATGQTVYIQSGLIQATDNVNELQGVIAHELGHVAGGHSIRLGEGAREATGITLATMVLGALAIAAGAGDAAMGIIAAGQQAAMGKFLAFTRTQESTADASAVKTLHAAGISGKGMLDFFAKLQNQEYRLAVYSKDSYDRTHPLNSERIQALEQNFRSDPAWNKPVDPARAARVERGQGPRGGAPCSIGRDGA